MADKNPSNSLIVPFNDLYPDNSQEQKTFVSKNVYEPDEDEKSDCNL